MIAGACAPEPLRVELGGFGLDVAAVLVLDPSGRVLRVTPTFGPSFGARPSLELDASEDAVVVGASRVSLLRSAPRALWGAVADVTLELEAPPERLEDALEGDARVLRFALPADATLVDLELAPAPRALLDRLTVRWRVPAREEGSPAALRAFGSSPRLFALDTEVPNLGSGQEAFYRMIRAIPLDDERVLFATERFVGVAERGQGARLAPEWLLTRQQLRPPSEELDIRAIALEPDGVHGYVAGELVSTGTGHIARFSLDARGLHALGTATISLAAPPPIDALAVAPDGAVLAAAKGGVVLLRDPRSGVFEADDALSRLHADWLRTASGFPGSIRRIAFRDDARAPQLLGTQSGVVIAGDARTGEWELLVDARGVAGRINDPDVSGIVAREDELWIATRTAGLIRARAGVRPTPLRFAQPFALRACGDPTAPVELAFAMLGLVLDAGHALVALEGCDGLLRLRVEDEASSAVLLDGASEARVVDEAEPLGTEAGARSPLVFGELGLLTELAP